MPARDFFVFGAVNENATLTHRKCAVAALLIDPQNRYHKAMEKLLEMLRALGFSEEECAAVKAKIEADEGTEKLEEYVLLIRLHYDDRHEYVD